MREYLVIALHWFGFEIGRCKVLAENSNNALIKASEYFKENNIKYEGLITHN